MKCLLKYQWVKLPRTHLPQGKGILGHWVRLAAKAAFRNGKAKYCGYINDVSVGTWAGGIVGLKSILRIKSRRLALDIMDTLSELCYLSYKLDPKTKKLTYQINDFVIKCSGADCLDGGMVYATDGYGFLCLPRNITERLAQQQCKFEDADAWLDLWCHTVFQDPRNAFSYMAPAVQFGQYGAASTLENLGDRWGWEKTKVWRFMQKHADTFKLHKLPGSYGCLIFNTLYPTEPSKDLSGTEITVPSQEDIMRILDEIRIMGENTHFTGTDHDRINRMVAWYSNKLHMNNTEPQSEEPDENRVALFAPIIRAYLSHCRNCKNCYYDCWMTYIDSNNNLVKNQIRGPCHNCRIPDCKL